MCKMEGVGLWGGVEKRWIGMEGGSGDNWRFGCCVRGDLGLGFWSRFGVEVRF